MPKRRILWFPVNGVDKTLPKSTETTSGTQLSDVVAYASASSEISSYNSRDLVTRRDLKSYSRTDFTTVYGLLRYKRGLAIAGSSGIYLDSVLKKSQSLSSYTWMAAWYDKLYWSNGTTWGLIDSDDTAYEMGIEAPSSWAATTSRFYEIYSDSGTNGSWDATTNTLTAFAGGFTSDLVGDYIQVYQYSQSTCFTGRVSTVPTATTLTILVDPEDTAAATDASAAIYFCISPNRWSTYRGYITSGGYTASDGISYPNSVSYKQRFYRSGDGARSNSATHPLTMVTNTLVGGLRVASIDASSDDSNVDKVEIFRQDSTVTTSVLYRKVGEVDLGTTTLEDTTTMSASLEALDDDEKYPCPYVLSNLMLYGSRLWGTYLNKVYYSEVYGDAERFQYFGAVGLNYFEFPDTVKTIIDYNRTLLVFLERETWLLEGLNPNTMNRRRLNKDIGTYSALSATVYKGTAFTVSADSRFYQIAGADWSEGSQITSLLPSSPSYVQLMGSDNALWISTGSQVIRYELTNKDAWVYSLSGYMGSGSHTTYLGQSGKVYEVDTTNGSESTPAAYIESPDIYIGKSDGHRGLLSRVLFRANCASGLLKIYVDGSLWKSVNFSTSGEETVSKHFWPVQGYYVKIRIESNQYNELLISGPVILNPF